MKLPNGEDAEVPLEKIADYLLSETHPVGKAKARFFRALGFGPNAAAELQRQLRRIAADGDVFEEIPTPFGTKHVVDGAITGAEGRSAMVRTVWIREIGRVRPRFVTARPL